MNYNKDYRKILKETLQELEENRKVLMGDSTLSEEELNTFYDKIGCKTWHEHVDSIKERLQVMIEIDRMGEQEFSSAIISVRINELLFWIDTSVARISAFTGDEVFYEHFSFSLMDALNDYAKTEWIENN